MECEDANTFASQNIFRLKLGQNIHFLRSVQVLLIVLNFHILNYLETEVSLPPGI